MNTKLFQFGNCEVTLEELVSRIISFDPSTKQIVNHSFIKIYNCYYIC